MSDAFQRGIERAVARKKNNVGNIKPVKVVQEKPVVKAVTGFDEEAYRTTIISKMIKLIHKLQG